MASKTYGTLTYGLQSGLLLDNFAKYDPQSQAQAFSVIGYSGFASGGGATETARFDSIKYLIAKEAGSLFLSAQLPGRQRLSRQSRPGQCGRRLQGPLG